QLVAYVTAAVGSSVDVDVVKVGVGERLASYMVPSQFVVLDALPLNASGKLDRKLLPEPVFERRSFRAPTTEAEILVASVVSGILGVDAVGLDDDFFELGGNSLNAMRVIAGLTEALGVNVPVRIVFDAPIMTDLASRIAIGIRAGFDVASDDAISVVLPLRTGGSERPLFCIHPMVGLAWPYMNLLPAVDRSIPVYGIQTPALTDEKFAPAELGDYMDRYVDEIIRVQAEGPYRLMGWSLGGVLAHGVATRLQNRGSEVETLVVVDSLPIAELTEAADSRPFVDHLREDFSAMGIAIPAGEEIGNLSRESLTSILKAVEGDRVGLSIDRIRQLFTSIEALEAMIDRYGPKVFDGDVIFVSSEQHPEPADAALLWQPYVHGVIDNFYVQCPHVAMMTPPASAEIGQVIDRALRTQY
ncbi:non-ribosomal peptide synthetase, partial [Rhodococcus erythropolis]